MTDKKADHKADARQAADERAAADGGVDGVDGVDAPVPRLPRTTHFKVSFAAIFRIFLTGCLLAMIIVARRPCADAVSGFVTSFDNTPNGSGSAAVQMPKPGTVDVTPADQGLGSAGDYETLRPGMTEEEIKAAIERAKAKARDRANAMGSNGPASGSSAMGSNAIGSNGSASGSSAGSNANAPSSR